MSILREFSSNIWIVDVKLSDYDVRGVLICAEEQVVVWDTLSHPSDMKPLMPLIGNRELVVIYSHADWDHIWGTAGLPYQNARIIGHALCKERFSNDVPSKLHEKKMLEPTEWDAVELIAPTTTFQRELSVDLGSTVMSLHHLPGHKPDSIVAFVPDQGILLMGDAVETPFPLVPAESPLPLWIAELQRWEADPRVQTVIPSHGVIGGREILRQNIDYLQNLLAGRDIVLPETLTDFYRATHRENVSKHSAAKGRNQF